MRILAGGRVIGIDQCPGFDCPREPLPEKLNVLLCLLDGTERRRQLAEAKTPATTPGDS